MLTIQLVGALLGVGLLKALLERITDWSETVQWTVTAASVAVLTVVSYVYTAYPTWPRHVREWQRQAILAQCPAIKAVPGRLTYLLGYPSDDLEVEDYARKLMDTLGDKGCKLSIAYGADPFPQALVVNERKVIVPPDNNLLLRTVGIQLWVLHSSDPPPAAKELATALDVAGIKYAWKSDIRLAGVAAQGAERFPINGPDCILLVGTKPPWSLHNWWFMEQRHLVWVLGQLSSSFPWLRWPPWRSTH